MNNQNTWRTVPIEPEIKPPSEVWRQKARAHLDSITKPLGSLGFLEDLAAQMVAIRQENFADTMSKSVYVFAADHASLPKA
jgi:nicotinate-nucleotide--dimethylbenzimidazole phosphoribosyltransferase